MKEVPAVKVRDVMSTELVTVQSSTTLRQAAVAMLNAGVSGLPVVDADGRLVGIITEADFVEQEAAHDLSYRPRLLDLLFGRGQDALASAETVRDVMTPEVATVLDSDRLAAAARMMVDRKVKRLPVIDDAGRLVGIISRADVLRVFARGDDEIRADIDELFNRLPMDQSEIFVRVTDGVVYLEGRTEAHSEAIVLADFVSHLDGVVRVESALGWLVDDRVAEQRWPGYAQAGGEV